MIKVLCIDGKWKGFGLPGNAPKEGHVYSVIREGVCECGFCGKQMYYLEECDHYMGWHQPHFIPLSDISETTFERNFIKEKL